MVGSTPRLWEFFVMKIDRANIIELLGDSKTRKEAVVKLRKWIDDNSDEIRRVYDGKWTIQQITARLEADLNSYEFEWNTIPPRREPTFGGFKAREKVPDPLPEPDKSLLAMEKDLVKKIEKEKEKGNHDKVKKLTDELIQIQLQQPQVGARFG